MRATARRSPPWWSSPAARSHRAGRGVRRGRIARPVRADPVRLRTADHQPGGRHRHRGAGARGGDQRAGAGEPGAPAHRFRRCVGASGCPRTSSGAAACSAPSSCCARCIARPARRRSSTMRRGCCSPWSIVALLVHLLIGRRETEEEEARPPVPGRAPARLDRGRRRARSRCSPAMRASRRSWPARIVFTVALIATLYLLLVVTDA